MKMMKLGLMVVGLMAVGSVLADKVKVSDAWKKTVHQTLNKISEDLNRFDNIVPFDNKLEAVKKRGNLVHSSVGNALDALNKRIEQLKDQLNMLNMTVQSIFQGLAE